MTALLQRVRGAHPTHGSFEAAEIQWWWTIPRSTDELAQLFWFDDHDRPEAAVTVTDFGDGSSALYEDPTLIVIVKPGATPDWIAHVVDRGLAHFSERGIEAVELEVDRADDTMRDVLFGHGFTVKGEGLVECWMDARSRPQISMLPESYRLFSRSETLHRPHHMNHPRRPDIEPRLLQTSLYRPELDLVILDGDDGVAAYGLFWHDPKTATGVVEPMRTQDDHQQRGLARHILTTGVDLLAKAGAGRIAITFDPGNPAPSQPYVNVGFEPHRQSDVFFRGAPTPLP